MGHGDETHDPVYEDLVVLTGDVERIRVASKQLQVAVDNFTVALGRLMGAIAVLGQR